MRLLDIVLIQKISGIGFFLVEQRIFLLSTWI